MENLTEVNALLTSRASSVQPSACQKGPCLALRAHVDNIPKTTSITSPLPNISTSFNSMHTVKPGKNTNSIRPGILFVFFGFVFVSWKEKNSGRILLVFFRLKARNTCRIRIRIFRKEFIPPENTFRSYFFRLDSTRCIVKASGFTRGVKIRDFIILFL